MMYKFAEYEQNYNMPEKMSDFLKEKVLTDC